jgi:hypothetical protein
LSFSENHEKTFRTFGHNYLKQGHFELFPKSGGFYSYRSDPNPGFGSGFFPEVGSGSGQNGPDPSKLLNRYGNFCLKMGYFGYKKSVFCVYYKLSTYLSDKMHIQKKN